MSGANRRRAIQLLLSVAMLILVLNAYNLIYYVIFPSISVSWVTKVSEYGFLKCENMDINNIAGFSRKEIKDQCFLCEGPFNFEIIQSDNSFYDTLHMAKDCRGPFGYGRIDIHQFRGDGKIYCELRAWPERTTRDLYKYDGPPPMGYVVTNPIVNIYGHFQK